MKKKIRGFLFAFCFFGACLYLPACGADEERLIGKSALPEVSQKDAQIEIPQKSAQAEKSQKDILSEGSQKGIPAEGSQGDAPAKESEESAAPAKAPSKQEVLAMRKTALKGMSEEEIARLTENIKTANLQMESAYLNDRLFDRLSDPDSLYWQYFDQKGDIQTGWLYNGNICDKNVIMRHEGLTEEEFYEAQYEPGIVYNRFDAANFTALIADMQKSVQDGPLSNDLQQLIDLTNRAAQTHEMEYASDIYKVLHDMDYFLLRYGIEDVGKYTKDPSVTADYYGVLCVYGAKPLIADVS